MPTFNSAGHLDSAILSVLNQNYVLWELIIVDGGSSDNTVDIIQDFCSCDARIRFLDNSANDIGAADARALGIKSSRAKYIAFLDSDDLWEREKLKLQVSQMECSGFRFTYTLYREITELGVLKSCVHPANPSYSYDSYLHSRGIGNLTVMVERDLFTPEILSTTQFRNCEDTLWWLLIMRKGIDAHLIPFTLGYYRIRPGSLSSNRIKNQLAVWQCYREALELNFLRCSFEYILYCLNVCFRKVKVKICSYFSMRSLHEHAH